MFDCLMVALKRCGLPELPCPMVIAAVLEKHRGGRLALVVSGLVVVVFLARAS